VLRRPAPVAVAAALLLASAATAFARPPVAPPGAPELQAAAGARAAPEMEGRRSGVLRERRPGDTVPVLYLRDGEPHEARATLGVRP
jgi:S1-C subfamily serine protease